MYGEIKDSYSGFGAVRPGFNKVEYEVPEIVTVTKERPSIGGII